MTNVKAWFSIALRPRNPEGSLGRTALDGHLDSHTAPELRDAHKGVWVLIEGTCEPVWPSGKALGWYAEGPRFDTASALLSLQKGCGLWTLSCDFVHHFLLKH